MARYCCAIAHRFIVTEMRGPAGNRGQVMESAINQAHASHELRQRVDSAIKGNPHLTRHRVFCQEESGIVVLHGRVGSFFQKQMAQETLKRLVGVEKVINELQVDWMATANPR